MYSESYLMTKSKKTLVGMLLKMGESELQEDIKNLEITDVEVWNEDDNKSIGIRLSWDSDIGWGRYTIGFSGGEWYVDDECMESPEDRKFGKLVFATWLDSLKNNPQYMFGE